MKSNSYGILSKYYDRWQEKLDVIKWADYVDLLIDNHYTKNATPILLDLGCGTGSFAIEMSRRGYDVIGIDNSPEMLALATEKDVEGKVRFIMQDITRMELFGTVDIMVCLLDTVNHIMKESDLNRFFALCKNYLNPHGILVFDMATPYYFEEVLGNKVFYESNEKHAIIWQNHFNPRKRISKSELTIFAYDESGLYRRFDEEIKERIYTPDMIRDMIKTNGLKPVKTYGDLKTSSPGNTSKRIFFVAENRKDDWKEALAKIPFEER